MRQVADKIMTLAQAVAWRDGLRAAQRRLVVTNGCFDLLHRGHVEYLSEARQLGDALLVAVNSDASVQLVKGPTRPLIPESDRAYMLAALETVDAVVVFTEQKPIPLFEALLPDVYVKGGDYTEQTTDREEYVILKRLGCDFRIVKLVPGHSTTALWDRLRALAVPGPRA